jgi:hypothetical protein
MTSFKAKLLVRRVTPSTNIEMFQLFEVLQQLTTPMAFLVSNMQGSVAKYKFERLETVVENLSTDTEYNKRAIFFRVYYLLLNSDIYLGITRQKQSNRNCLKSVLLFKLMKILLIYHMGPSKTRAFSI